ncbi:hypothetical protein CEUSTIGMA_g7510.t1 [Chlamydomonas eustigma]|uniref:Importin N-terminal domain-containing protein n=1 Tax=Chlamydomonas eustigma TaxID=1157962 RepID=A0A250XB20_9CHLO|nr:hypothetical protein CEUSTIGMA_g7510.t1 [Chlamydomonas eustigma]|eukprot:GAX80072.1 hypothetical protein CEUSTIGMA_g7510.t1 [Chlamydomonas eustigma]
MDLTECFQQTLSQHKEIIQQAEAKLKSAAQITGFSTSVLKVVAQDGLDASIRQAAAVSFKNHVKYHWAPSELHSENQPISQPEKDQIKGLLPGLMLSTPPLVQAQLSEALSIVCSHDFPRLWPNLLSELVERLNNADLKTISGVLATANSIFKRYRNQYGSNAMVQELEHSQNVFAGPLLETTQRLGKMVSAAAADVAALKQILLAARYAFRTFFSLNAPGLTPLMEGQLDSWMAEFHTFLVYENPVLDESDPEKESVLDSVKSAACQNINLFMEINEEEFAKFLQTFVADVWGLLMAVSQKPSQDNLVMNAIRFLTTVSRSVHYQLFNNAGALQQICEKVVVPNLRTRPEDEEVFEMNPVEYIRRDAEGSDSDTRRRAAADFVKSLTERFPQEVTQLFTGYVQAMLSEYAANPVLNWKAKDTAIYLVLALTVQGKTGAQGATTTNQLVSVHDFFASQVLPELQSAKVNDHPILKADAIKFVTTFRSLLPKATCLALFPSLISMLGSEYNVVHSYAALAIERMLLIKEQGHPRFTPADVAPILQALLEKLFGGFKLPESSENEYLMKAVMRVISFVGPDISPVAPICLQTLAQMLVEVCKNPKNPGFNHYLFESVAALIKQTCGVHGGAMIETVEQMLFPAFNLVLQQDVQEFHPYVFQIFAQLIELRGKPLPGVYLQIFPPLLNAMFWERPGNVPALVRLIQAYLLKAGDEVMAGGHLLPLLGVFQKLIASKAHDHEGFEILNALVENLPVPAYETHMPTICTLLFGRLQSSRTQKFVKGFVSFLAFFLVKHGPQLVATTVDRVQPGIFMMLVQQVWLPNMHLVSGSDEEKVVLVATAKCLCDYPPLQQAKELWTALKDEAVKTAQGQGGVPDAGFSEELSAELEELQGYSTAYAKLANAARPERPVLAEIPDPKQYLESSLARVMAGR